MQILSTSILDRALLKLSRSIELGKLGRIYYVISRSPRGTQTQSLQLEFCDECEIDVALMMSVLDMVVRYV